MLIIQRLLSITVLIIATDVYAQDKEEEHHGPQTCGGRLKGPVGIIKTPNFPNAFPVPIRCKWIIENDKLNGTISIYFTQQYTTSGLTFTEYTYYDDSYKLEERRALTVTEENITKVKWLKVQSPVLVVELTLSRLEGTQLRALGLLSVFGFNITYAVRGPSDSQTPSSCSAIECRLLGNCYASQNYSEFYCSCYDGYSGVDCGVGLLCLKTSNMCKNGGTCRQMGPAAVSCSCTPGFTGDLCETQVSQAGCSIECSEGCKHGTSCDCNPKDIDTTTAHFETTLQVVDQPHVNISQEIIKQLTSYFHASNITLLDEIEILNINAVGASGTLSVRVRMWADRAHAEALRAALARLSASRARVPVLRLLPGVLNIIVQPALNLNALAINQRPEIWEGSEFTLTCMAYGSPDITFTWYKDGVKINFNGTTREMWTRSVSEEAIGRRMSVLGVSAAEQIDSGSWSCAADDASRRRCRALTLTVLSPPTVRLVPATLTVFKGDNVSITCLAGAGRAHGVLGFSWARERSLLPMQPDRHVWEDLYPAGSVLKLYNVQKSSEYRCQVSSVAGTNSACVTVWALSPDDEACQSDSAHGTRWSRTAPGAYGVRFFNKIPLTVINLPLLKFKTAVKRFCVPKSEQHGVKWMLPDFSGCVADSLKYIYDQFVRISHGYSWNNVSDVSHRYLSVLRILPMHRGVGVTPLRQVSHMLQYLLSDAAQHVDRVYSASHLLNIFDLLLTQPDALLDEQKIYELQNAIIYTAGLRSQFSVHLHSFSVASDVVMRGNSVNINLHHAGTDEWLLTSAMMELDITSDLQKVTLMTVLYYNLEARLPSLRRAFEFSAGREVQYVVCSQQVQVSVSGAASHNTVENTIALTFQHTKNYSIDATKLACGFRPVESPGVWNLLTCDMLVSQTSSATCRCRGAGTVALLTRTTEINTALILLMSMIQTDADSELRGVVVISVDVCGAMCACACALQLLSLAPAAAQTQDSLAKLLRAVNAGAYAAAMFTLLHCDSRQVACAGVLGWVVAACFCTACAALCAMPLLLHQELAGRRQRGHSVGLLAGICVMCCLTARLWGGTPLQLGSAASNIFAGVIILLSLLALLLVLCARKTLRHITHKLPPDRRAYIKDKSAVIHNTLVLLLTTSVALAAGVTYVQPGDKRVVHVIVLSMAALTNGVTMLVCYVIRDEKCLHALRSILAQHDNTEWQESPAGDTSLSLYIRQSGEVESRGGVVILESCSSPVSPTGYWKGMPIERRQSNPDSRADIVQCVENRSSMCGGARHYDTHTRAVCDLIPTGTRCSGGEYMATVCLERNVRQEVEREVPAVDSYVNKRVDTDKATCSICVQSNPDISKITSTPMKNCLKPTSEACKSSTSMPSIDAIKDDKKIHIEHINKQWNKAYNNQQTEKVLHKISNDLDFLLNRIQMKNSTDQIEEAPT